MPILRNKRQSSLEGASILVAATVITKIIGAIFKIPLGNLIGEIGMGYFQTAYDLYMPVYVIALAGMPIAVCRMVAESVADERYNDTHRIIKVALKVFTIIGIVAFVLLAAAAYPYLKYIPGNTNGLSCVLAIAPSIICCCIVSAYRGYYQGLSNMTVTATTEVIEAVGKLIIGLGFAFVIKKLGGAPQYQAAGAIMGITVGTLFSALYTVLRYKFGGDGITVEQLQEALPPQEKSATRKALLAISIPVVIGALANQIASLVDTMTVQSCLRGLAENHSDYLQSAYPQMWANIKKDIVGVTGAAFDERMAEDVSTYLYGCFKGFAFSIFNLVPNITTMIGVGAFPTMTTVFKRKDKEGVKKSFEMVIRTSALLAFPSGIGIFVLSKGIMDLLYPSKPVGAAITAPVLAIFGIAVLFCGLSLPMTSLLQAIGKERIPVYNVVAAGVVKIIVNYILVSIPSMNIKGAAIGTLVCYAMIFFLDFLFMCKYTKVIPNLVSTILKPLLSAIICGIAAYGVNFVCLKFLPVRISTIIAILAAAVVYVIAIIVFKVLSKDDILSMPKGEKLLKICTKLKIVR